jgi:DNA-binding NarL/FixJ family response regulator
VHAERLKQQGRLFPLFIFEMLTSTRRLRRLVAAGRSNAQIGAELFISRGTAAVHVTSILRKLGVASGPRPWPNAPGC